MVLKWLVAGLHVFVILALVSALWLFTFLAAAHYQTAVPVGDGLEVWDVDAVEGWCLVVPSSENECVVENELARKVVGIGSSNSGYIVKQRNGERLVVSRDGQSWNARGLQSDSPATYP